MKTAYSTPQLANVALLAGLLQRLEQRAGTLDPEPYRAVVQRLAQAFGEVPADAPLDALLRQFPAAAEVYENLNYEHAGLCRSPLDAASAAELAAHGAIERARHNDGHAAANS